MAITTTSSGFPLKLYKQTFTSSSTWTCPSGTTTVDLVMAGGGGGGGSAITSGNANYNAAAGGGGAGQLVRTSVSVTPGTTYTVTIGAGGTGSTSYLSAGGNGGNTSFGLTSTLANGFVMDGILSQLSSYNSYTTPNTAYNTSGLPSTQYNSFIYPGGWTWKGTSGGATFGASTPAYTTNATYGTTSFDTTVLGIANSLTAPAGHNGYFFNYYLQNTVAFGEWMAWIPVTTGTAYIASNSMLSQSASTQIAARIEWYQSYQGTFISANSNTTTTITANTWTQQSVTATAPALATYALVRFQACNTTGGGYVFGCNHQFEQGSSVTSYKGPSYGSGAWTQTGILNVTGGAVASGGGGGGSARVDVNGAYTGFPGIGGGAGVASQNASMLAGNGGGYDEGIPLTIFDTGNTATASYIIFLRSLQNPTQSRPTDSVTLGASATPNLSLGTAPKASPEGLCGGGGGGFITQFSNVNVQYGTSQRVSPGAGQGGNIGNYGFGAHALPNTGSGGGGGSSYQVTTSSVGGNGGSGVIYLSYWGI